MYSEAESESEKRSKVAESSAKPEFCSLVPELATLCGSECRMIRTCWLVVVFIATYLGSFPCVRKKLS